MRSYLFNRIKNIIPKISSTELIALTSGTTSLDRQIFQGNVSLPKYINVNNSNTFKKFNSSCDILLNNFNDDNVYPSPNYNDILNYISKEKFFSFIIDDKYGGNKLTTKELSSILTKITSQNPAIGVTVMVPNSLGPGELLQHYGSDEQKNYFLPKLASGDLIPCFGLTGQNNGSDAVGQIDEGIIKKEGEKLVIDIKINKRYITLAPVANLIGLAFKLKDPSGLLKEGKEGITVALIKGNHKGLIKETHHIPLNAGFPNGTLKGNIKIEVNDIIGGEKNIGNGWKMLMECLAAGRGVCLPATALASSKVATYGIYNYSNHRKQFNLPIIKMEGVNKKFLDMVYNTWVIQSSVHLTNYLLDQGEKPAVLSAVMKQQTTDRAREVLNNAMDIHAGSAICLGRNNFLEKFYRSAPIGITVEGSNTLTKNLIIFGQGLNKSHPYIFPIFESILNNDIKNFNKNLKKIISHSLLLYLKTFTLFNTQLEKQTIDFACLSNFIALKGGSLKKEQYLSGDMADIFSNLYLAYSVKWYQENFNISNKLTNYCIDRLLEENIEKFNRIIDNSDLKFALIHLKKKYHKDLYRKNTIILEEIKNNKKIMNFIKEDVFMEGTILEDLEKLNLLDENSLEYKQLYDKVISVGEFKNI